MPDTAPIILVRVIARVKIYVTENVKVDADLPVDITVAMDVDVSIMAKQTVTEHHIQ